jgi:hypothetical protein
VRAVVLMLCIVDFTHLEALVSEWAGTVSTLVSDTSVSAVATGFHGSQLLFASGSRVFAHEFATGVTLTLAGSSVGSSDGLCPTARFSSSISCIIADVSTSDLLVCDAGNNMIRRVEVDGDVGSCVLTAIHSSPNAATPAVIFGGVSYYGVAAATVVGDVLYTADPSSSSVTTRSVTSGEYPSFVASLTSNGSFYRIYDFLYQVL